METGTVVSRTNDSVTWRSDVDGKLVTDPIHDLEIIMSKKSTKSAKLYRGGNECPYGERMIDGYCQDTTYSNVNRNRNRVGNYPTNHRSYNESRSYRQTRSTPRSSQQTTRNQYGETRGNKNYQVNFDRVPDSSCATGYKVLNKMTSRLECEGTFPTTVSNRPSEYVNETQSNTMKSTNDMMNTKLNRGAYKKK
tara:strand:+ start:156 stop:737 length:582 start_codon:yes stop_codon:yes gene_type:complete